MAICLVQSMARAMELGHSQLVSKFCGLSVQKDSWSLSIRGSSRTRRTTHMSLSNGRKGGEGGADDQCGYLGRTNLGHILERRDFTLKPAKMYCVNDSLLRAGLIIACPSLGLGVIDSNALAAAELGPISSSLSAIDMLPRFVSYLGDLDPGTAQLATSFVGPVITIFNLLFIFQIVMSWYPGIPVKKFPFFLAYNSTEPVLGPTRRLIPPVGGVDVAPVIWVALMSFANKILLGALVCDTWRSRSPAGGSVFALIEYSSVSNCWEMPSPFHLKQIPLSGRHHMDLIVTDSIGLEGAIAAKYYESRRFEIDYTERFAGGRKNYFEDSSDSSQPRNKVSRADTSEIKNILEESEVDLTKKLGANVGKDVDLRKTQNKYESSGESLRISDDGNLPVSELETAKSKLDSEGEQKAGDSLAPIPPPPVVHSVYYYSKHYKHPMAKLRVLTAEDRAPPLQSNIPPPDREITIVTQVG